MRESLVQQLTWNIDVGKDGVADRWPRRGDPTVDQHTPHFSSSQQSISNGDS